MFDRFTRSVSDLAGEPATFLCALALIILWAACGPFFHYSELWQMIVNTGTTIVSFLLLFVVQSSQNRDGSALHAKLDELIAVTEAARNDLIKAETKTVAEINDLRKD